MRAEHHGDEEHDHATTTTRTWTPTGSSGRTTWSTSTGSRRPRTRAGASSTRTPVPPTTRSTGGSGRDKVKLRLVNEMDSDHPMHHPFHVHGAGRFVVLARDGVADDNLVWKDTVLVRTGETVDILLDVTNAGIWMAHCHIAEHHESGMMSASGSTTLESMGEARKPTDRERESLLNGQWLAGLGRPDRLPRIPGNSQHYEGYREADDRIGTGGCHSQPAAHSRPPRATHSHLRGHDCRRLQAQDLPVACLPWFSSWRHLRWRRPCQRPGPREPPSAAGPERNAERRRRACSPGTTDGACGSLESSVVRAGFRRSRGRGSAGAAPRCNQRYGPFLPSSHQRIGSTMQFLGTGKYGWAQMVMAGDGWKRPEISPNQTTRPFSARKLAGRGARADPELRQLVAAAVMLARRLAEKRAGRACPTGQCGRARRARPFNAGVPSPECPGVYRGALATAHPARPTVTPSGAENRAAARMDSRLPLATRIPPDARAEASIRRCGRHRPGRSSRLGLCLDRGMGASSPRTQYGQALAYSPASATRAPRELR